MDDRNRRKFTYLSYLLSILIVYQHAVNYLVYNLSDGPVYWIEKFYQGMTYAFVPAMYLISGFLFFYNYNREVLLEKWKRRVFSLLFPYLIWNTLSYLYYVLLGNVPFIQAHLNRETVVFSVKTLLLEAFIGNYNILWFVERLMIYCLITPLFVFLLRRKSIGWIVPVVAAVVGPMVGSGWMSWWALYALGAYFGLSQRDVFLRESYPKTTKLVSLSLILALGMISVLGIDLWGNKFEFLIRLVGALAIWILGDIFKNCNLPAWYMKISFFIYVSHSMILESLEKIILLLFGKSQIAALVDFLFAPVLTVGIITIAAWVLKKWPIGWKVICGGRG